MRDNGLNERRGRVSPPFAGLGGHAGPPVVVLDSAAVSDPLVLRDVLRDISVALPLVDALGFGGCRDLRLCTGGGCSGRL